LVFFIFSILLLFSKILKTIKEKGKNYKKNTPKVAITKVIAARRELRSLL